MTRGRGPGSTLLVPVLFFLALGLVLPATADRASAKDRPLFQVSTIRALLAGVYDGETTMADLLSHGGLGLGTFNGLDGEMIVLDGVVYRASVNSTAAPAPLTDKTPFAMVVPFSCDRIVKAGRADSLADLKWALTRSMATDNLFHAFRMEGRFQTLRVRSVPAQDKPYRPLAEAVKGQEVYGLTEIDGVLLGFYAPEYAAGVTVPGFHFHFISRDRTTGGHVLDCSFEEMAVKVDVIRDFSLHLPTDRAFGQADLSGERKSELERVEKTPGTAD